LATPYILSKSIIYILNTKDDGIGFDFEKELMKKSPGLKSIRSRVDYLKGNLEFSNGTENVVQYVIGLPIKVG
jgi:signal transduction histidine kinase